MLPTIRLDCQGKSGPWNAPCRTGQPPIPQGLARTPIDLSSLAGAQSASKALAVGWARDPDQLTAGETKQEMGVKSAVGVKAALLAAGVGLALAAGCSPASAANGYPSDIDATSGNRLPVPKRADLSPADQKTFDEIEGKLGEGLPALEKDRPLVRMYSPGVAKGLGEAHHYLKYDAGFDARLETVAVLTVTRQLTNQFEWTQWEAHAREQKDPRYLEPYVIDVIKSCKPVTGLGEKDAAIVTLGREMFGPRKVSSETFAKVLQLFGPRKTVDLAEMMSLYAATTDELVVFDQQLHPGQTPLLAKNATPCGVSGPNMSWVADVLR